MEKKFELTEKYVVNELGTKLYQIKCTKTFEYAKKGELGGYIEREVNLSQGGNAWVSGDVQVYGNARVSGDAWVSGDAQVYGNARVSGDAWVSGDAQVYGDARVSGDAQVSGNACLKSNADHCGFDCFGSSNRHTHAYLTSDNAVEITCGYFRGSIEEFEKKVKNTHAGTVYENQYNAIINVIKIKFGSAQRQNRQV